MPNADHLEKFRFKPGCAPGPGAPRRRPLSEAADERLRTVLPEELRVQLSVIVVNGVKRQIGGLPKGSTYADAIVWGLTKKAIQGDKDCAKELRESAEGRSSMRIELLPQADREILLQVEFEDSPLTRRLAERVIDVDENDDDPPAEPSDEAQKR
jgi:hypothetical protein